MKKTYMTPALAMTVIEQSESLMLALSVNNTAEDNVAGDVKAAGEWEDIWDEE